MKRQKTNQALTKWILLAFLIVPSICSASEGDIVLVLAVIPFSIILAYPLSILVKLLLAKVIISAMYKKQIIKTSTYELMLIFVCYVSIFSMIKEIQVIFPLGIYCYFIYMINLRRFSDLNKEFKKPILQNKYIASVIYMLIYPLVLATVATSTVLIYQHIYRH